MKLNLSCLALLASLISVQIHAMEPRGLKNSSWKSSLKPPKAWEPGPLLGKLGSLANETQQNVAENTGSKLFQEHHSVEISREGNKKAWFKKTFVKIINSIQKNRQREQEYKIYLSFDNDAEQEFWQKLFNQQELPLSACIQESVVDKMLVFTLQINPKL